MRFLNIVFKYVCERSWDEIGTAQTPPTSKIKTCLNVLFSRYTNLLQPTVLIIMFRTTSPKVNYYSTMLHDSYQVHNCNFFFRSF